MATGASFLAPIFASWVLSSEGSQGAWAEDRRRLLRAPSLPATCWEKRSSCPVGKFAGPMSNPVTVEDTAPLICHLAGAPRRRTRRPSAPSIGLGVSHRVYADPIRRWRTHKQLMRELSHAVRDRRELVGGNGAQSVGRHQQRMLALARALWNRSVHTLRLLRSHAPSEGCQSYPPGPDDKCLSRPPAATG